MGSQGDSNDNRRAGTLSGENCSYTPESPTKTPRLSSANPRGACLQEALFLTQASFCWVGFMANLLVASVRWGHLPCRSMRPVATTTTAHLECSSCSPLALFNQRWIGLRGGGGRYSLEYCIFAHNFSM
jgi:hypothetical protein